MIPGTLQVTVTLADTAAALTIFARVALPLTALARAVACPLTEVAISIWVVLVTEVTNVRATPAMVTVEAAVTLLVNVQAFEANAVVDERAAEPYLIVQLRLPCEQALK